MVQRDHADVKRGRARACPSAQVPCPKGSEVTHTPVRASTTRATSPSNDVPSTR